MNVLSWPRTLGRSPLRSSRAGVVALLMTLLSAAATGGAVAGCGGKGKGAEAPTSSAASPTAKKPDEAGLEGSAKGLYEKGWEAYRKGELAEAAAAFNEAASKSPQAAAPRHALGLVLEAQGNTAAAQEQYRAALGVQPDFEPAIGSYAMS